MPELKLLVITLDGNLKKVLSRSRSDLGFENGKIKDHKDRHRHRKGDEPSSKPFICQKRLIHLAESILDGQQLSQHLLERKQNGKVQDQHINKERPQALPNLRRPCNNPLARQIKPFFSWHRVSLSSYGIKMLLLSSRRWVLLLLPQTLLSPSQPGNKSLK